MIYGYLWNQHFGIFLEVNSNETNEAKLWYKFPLKFTKDLNLKETGFGVYFHSFCPLVLKTALLKLW